MVDSPIRLSRILPLVLVGVANKRFTIWIPQSYSEGHSFDPAVIGDAAPIVQQVSSMTATWAVEGALLVGIFSVIAFAWKPVMTAVIAALPGFLVVANALGAIPDPLVNEAVTVTALAGITGSASGGMGIAPAAMADTFIANANAAGIPMDVLHRVAAMASGGKTLAVMVIIGVFYATGIV